MQKINPPQFGQASQPFDRMQLARMQADTVNAMAGDLKGYDCPHCRNRGYTMIVRPDGTLACRVCSCDTIRRCINRMERSGLKASIQERRLDAFQVKEPWQEALKKTAEQFVREPKGWLLYCGQPGSGKTHLCTAVCRELLYKGMQVYYAGWRDEVQWLKNYHTDPAEREKRLREIKTSQVLYIDDLFKSGGDAPTAADLSIAFEILNYRYQNRLITIISTELSPEDLVTLDEATGSRIIEAASGNIAFVMPSRARNYRLRGEVKV